MLFYCYFLLTVNEVVYINAATKHKKSHQTQDTRKRE